MIETCIDEILKRDECTRKSFFGVKARDELPIKVTYPSCFIINTKPRDHPGEHWLALHYDKHGEAFFFDSYGMSPAHFNLDNFLKRTSKTYFYNKKRIQGLSTYCGLYCILFLLFKCRNKTSNFFAYFTKDVLLNDKKMTCLIKKFQK